MEATRPRKLVLCFDGTGNKFRGDDSDSNILKIFRMLDRTAGDQYHYYQPGIGTYVVSKNLSRRSPKARLRSWYKKAKDSAIGTSFDQHVVGGYRFLMRFYNPGDEIYMFGFSRGAYIARFLAEMLDYVGLLSHGNEEMVQFAWKAFSQWQCRRNDHAAAGDPLGSAAAEAATRRKHEMYAFMKGFRETFSRPVRRIRFLGLFDTVNSVPHFETAWMERSQFPYTARTSAKVIRHAVALDERRARFRQDLIYQSAPAHKKKAAPAEKKTKAVAFLQPRRVLRDLHGKKHHPGQDHVHEKNHTRPSEDAPPHTAGGSSSSAAAGRGRHPSRLAAVQELNAAAAINSAGDRVAAAVAAAVASFGSADAEAPAPYRAHSRSRSRESVAGSRRRHGGRHGHDNISEFSRRLSSCASDSDDDDDDDDAAAADAESAGDYSVSDDDAADQDVLEAWFAGGHGDTGGGWPITPGTKSASHVPLAWMVREAMRAGLAFDAEKVVAMGCSDVLENQAAPNLLDVAGPTTTTPAYAAPGTTSDAAAQPMVVVSEASSPESIEPPTLLVNDETPQPAPPTLQVNSHDVVADDADPAAAGAAAAPPAAPSADEASPRAQFHAMLHRAHLAPIHDSLAFGGGLSAGQVLVWRLMEYLPFRRMDLQADGSWQPIRWPLPRGEVRDVPDAVIVHGSVLRRMRADPAYRPGNLIVGGGGRGCRVAPAHYGMGEWECIAEPGDPIGELWAKRAKVAEAAEKEGCE